MNWMFGLVDYNSLPETQRCIASIRVCQPDAAIVVIDNGGSLREDLLDATLIRPVHNLGFAGGVNLLLAHAKKEGTDAIWLLNNDCILQPGATATMAGLMTRLSADLYTSVITHGATDEVWFGGGILDAKTGRTRHRHYGEVYGASVWPDDMVTDWASGASLVVPKRVVSNVARLDERLFLYLEELEWQLSQGLSIAMSGEPLVAHYAGSTTHKVHSGLQFFFTARNRAIITERLPLFKRSRFHHTAAWIVDFLIKPLVRGQWNLIRLATLGYANRNVDGYTALEILVLQRRSEGDGV